MFSTVLIDEPHCPSLRNLTIVAHLWGTSSPSPISKELHHRCPFLRNLITVTHLRGTPSSPNSRELHPGFENTSSWINSVSLSRTLTACNRCVITETYNFPAILVVCHISHFHETTSSGGSRGATGGHAPPPPNDGQIFFTLSDTNHW